MRIRVDDATIDVAIDGSGEAVLFVHGFPFAKEVWDAQARRVAQFALAIRPDLRGMGSSTIAPGPYLMETFAGDLAAVLDALQIDRAAIVGHSMGGYVAMAFARMYTERVSKLVLVCSRLQNDSPQAAADREAFAQRIESNMEAAIFGSPYFKGLFSQRTVEDRAGAIDAARAIARRNSPAGLAAAMRGMAVRADARDIAPELAFPVLVVAGRDDRVVGIEEAEAMRAAFPAADLRVMGASAHVPMLEQPEALSDVLEAFLRTGGCAGTDL